MMKNVQSRALMNLICNYLLFQGDTSHMTRTYLHYSRLPQGEIRILTNGISEVTSVSISSSETSNFQRTECSARVCAARRQQPLCATLRI